MPRYIVHGAKDSLESSILNTREGNLNLEERQSILNQGLAERSSDENITFINEYLDEFSQTSANINLVSKLTFLGSHIIDMSEEEASKFSDEFPSASVLLDDTLNLIEPIDSPLAELKNDVDEQDLWHLQSIGLTKAINNGFSGSGKGVSVAILDTGIEEHPEISGKILGAYEFESSLSRRFIPVSTTRDTYGHGTHIAGLICGKKVGVAPEAKVVNILMLPNGEGTIADFLTAIEFAISLPGIQIINVSAGRKGSNADILRAIETSLSVGILPIVAVGNEGSNTSRIPGNCNLSVSIGASDKNDKIAGFSGGGNILEVGQSFTIPDFVAPGVRVFSANKGGGYIDKQGTSMATPIVSGIAALIIEKFPDINISDLVNLLLSSCKDLQLPVDRQGKGLIQIPNSII